MPFNQDSEVLPHILNKLKSVCIFTSSLTILLTLHIILGWIWLTMFIFRRAVIYASKLVSGLGRPLSGKDVLLLEDYSEPHRVSSVLLMTMDGDISASALRELFTKNVLQVRNKGSSTLKVPELQQYQTTFLGYRFWKDDPTFNIGNHINEVFYGGGSTPEYFKDFEAMLKEFSGKPYPIESSPWEIWIVRHFSVNGRLETIIIWRCHHSLMDGFSIVDVFINYLGQNPIRLNPKAKLFKSTNNLSILNALATTSAFISGFFSLLGAMIHNRLAKRVFSIERRKRGIPQRDQVHFKVSPTLPLSQVKAVAAKLGVRVPTLLTTMIADSIANVVRTELDTLNAAYVLPLPNHPGATANHMALGLIKFPMSNSQSFPSKLKSVNDTFLQLPANSMNGVIRYLEYVLGDFFPRFVLFLRTQAGLAYTPISITNFVMDSEGFQIGGLPCVDIMSGFSPFRGATDSVIHILGYKESIHVCFVVDDSIACEEDVEKMTAEFGRRFEELLHKTT